MKLKKILRQIVPATAALLGLGAPVMVQPAMAEEAVLDRSDADPALWKLSDEDTTIYMFGTMHLLKPDLVWFDDAVSEAFAASDELVVEMVEPGEDVVQQQMMAHGIRTDGSTMSSALTAQQHAKLAAATEKLGMPAAMLEPMQPWFAGLILSLAPMEKLGYSGEAGVEKVLEAQAAERSMPVSGLEGFSEQLGFFSSMSEEAQIGFLMEAVEQLDEAEAMYAEMEDAWGLGDVNATADLINEGMEATPEVYDALLVNRNANWADWVVGRMAQPGTVFMAVGAGHLSGDDSVQAMLAKRGLVVERVQY